MKRPIAKRSVFFIAAVLALVLLCSNLETLLVWSLCWQRNLDLPPNTEVIVSACRSPVVVGVPGGEVLFVREHRPEKMYLLDLRTGEKRAVPDDPLFLKRGVFLNSELAWLEGSPGGLSNPLYTPHYIFDLTNGKRYELTDLTAWSGQPKPPDYVPYFQSADQVFVHHGNNRAIALPPDFPQHPEEGVILYKSQLNSETDFENGEALEIIMKDLGMQYENIDYSLRYADLPSPTGKYVVRNDGIYFSGMNTPVVTPEYAGVRFLGGYFRGWYYDESGVVVQRYSSFLISNSLIGSHYPIPEPVLKLRLP